VISLSLGGKRQGNGATIMRIEQPLTVPYSSA
jgi:hypothetical protein